MADGCRTAREQQRGEGRTGPVSDEPIRITVADLDADDDASVSPSSIPPAGERLAPIPLHVSVEADAPALTKRLVVDTRGPASDQPARGAAVRVDLSTESPVPTQALPPALRALDLFVTTPAGDPILEGVDLVAERGTLTAIVGPTGAGKSTLLRALTGGQPPSSGSVLVDGLDLYAHYGELAGRIGHVPQDDIVHSSLTARQALRFGAELRFPPGASAAAWEQRVEDVLTALGLAIHADKPISRLSGGQRKRVSVALEMLTEPEILLLDEPTSGLDPAYEKSIMELLRQLADGGRTVVVVTHSVASLDLCDQVVFLGNGGWVGFAGTLEDAMAHFRTREFPEIFRTLDQPAAVRAVPRAGTSPAMSPGKSFASPVRPAKDSLGVLTRRNIAILRSDPKGLLVLAGAALVPAVLLLALIDAKALTPDADLPSTSGRTLLAGMVVTLGVIGAANGIREIVKESAIYRRERGTGLSRTAYLLSKLWVLGVVTAVQAVVVVFVATLRTGVPGGVVFPSMLELQFILVLSGLVTLALGLAVSALVTSSEKAMALVPVLFVLLWLFSGSVSDLAGKPVLSQIAYLSPSNWAMAATAGTVDLYGLEHCDEAPPAPDPATGAEAPASGRSICDARWRPSAGSWFAAVAALLALGAASLLVADWALARKEPVEAMRREHLVGRLIRGVRPPARQ